MTRRTSPGARVGLPWIAVVTLACVASLAAIIGATPAFAVNYTWDSSGGTPLDDGSGTWTSSGGTNWFNGTTYSAWGNTTSDVAFFGVGSGAAGTVTVSGSVTTNGLTFNAAGSGNYTLSGGTIGLGGTTPTITVNAAGTTTIGSLLTGAAGMVKSGTGTLSLTGLSSSSASNYSGSTVIGQGTLAITSAGTAALSGGLVLGASVGATDTANLDLTNGSASFSSLTVQTNSTGTNIITIGSGRTLTTSGNVSVGPNAASTTNLTVAGASAGVGTWAVSSAASGATFGVNMTTTAVGSIVTADLSTLGAFTLNYSAGNSLLRIGPTQTGNVTATSTLTLAGSSTITVAKIGLLTDGVTGGQYTLNLGSGVQQLNTDLIEINRGGRGNATVQFAGATGSVILRAQNGTGRANIYMINNAGPTTGSVLYSTMNLAGHDADLLVGTLAMMNISNSGTSYISTFSFDQGKLDVTTLTMAARSGGSAGTPSATVSLGSASNLVNTSTIGTIAMAANSNTAGAISATLNIAGANTTVTSTGAWTVSSVTAASASTATATGTVNISGGTVNANAGIILRSGSGFGTANGTLSITGGSLVSGGNITSTGSFSGGAATLTLNGGSLDMGGFAIGGSGQTVTTNFQSGTLSSVTEINAGAGWSKTTANTLVLTGSNTYMGTTSVSAGILTLANQNAARNSTLNISTGTVTFSSGVAANAFTVGGLTGSGNLTLANNAGSPAAIVLSVGNADVSTSFSGTLAGAGSLVKIGTGTFTLQAANTYTGTTAINAGSLNVGSANALGGGGNLTFGGGSLQYSVANTTDYAARIKSSGSAVSIDTNGRSVTFASAVDNTNTAGLTKLGTGTLTLLAANGYTGTTNINAGVLALSGVGTLGATTNSLALGGGSLDLGGLSRTAGNISVTAAAAAGDTIQNGTLNGTAFSISLTTGTATVSASLAGTANLTKTGTGTLTLSAANTYNGATTISAGTLALGVNGSFDSSPTITIGDTGSLGAVLDLTAKSNGFAFGSGQTVKGIGTIQMASGKALTINGTLAAGNSPGTLTISGGDLILGGSSITSYEINGADATVGSGINDLTRVAGSLTLGGTINVSASPAFDRFGSRSYRIFDYATGGSGSLSGTGSVTIGTPPSTDYLYSLTSTATTVNLFVQRKAEQAATLGFSLPTSGSVNAFTSTNVSFSGTLANLTPFGGKDLAVSLSGIAGQLSVVSLSASSGSTVTGGASAMITGQIASGTTLGARSWNVMNTDTTALGSTTSTASGVVNVFAHGAPTLSVASINFGRVLTSTTASQTVTVSNGTSSAAHTGGITWTAAATPSGFGAGGAAQAGVVASGSGVTYTYTLATGSAASYSGSQAFSFNDDASILGSGALGGLSVSLSGTVVNQRSFSVSNSGTINLGNFLRTAAVSGSATVSSTGLDATTARASLGAFAGTNTNGFSLGSASTTAFNGDSATQTATYTLSGSASSAGSINGSFASTVTAELGTIAPVTVALVGTAYDAASIAKVQTGSVSSSGTLSITNASGSYRSAAYVSGTSLTGQGWSVTGFALNSSAAAGAALAGTAHFDGTGLLSGIYTGTFSATFQNNQSLTGATANDLSSVSWSLYENYINASGTGSTTLAANTSLSAVSLSSGTGAGATVASFAAGVTGASSADITMSFSSGGTGLFSDVLNLHGTNGLAQVLQLTYDRSLLGGTSEDSLALAWLDPATSQWVNSVLGNTGNALTWSSGFLGAWSDYVVSTGGTATAANSLGAFGVDKATKTVWAAINHNSQFAVTATVIVPEPGSLALASLGIGLAGWSVWKRRRTVQK